MSDKTRTELEELLYGDLLPPKPGPNPEEAFLKSIPRLREAAADDTDDIDPRSGFLLSRIDGKKTVAEIMVVAGTGRREVIQRIGDLFSRGLVNFGEDSQRSGAFLDNYGRVLSETEKEEIRLTWLRMAKENPFDRLGLKPGSREPEIRQAYWELSRKFHPDRYAGIELGDCRVLLQEINSRITEAYQELKSPRTGGKPKAKSPSGSAGEEGKAAGGELFLEAQKALKAGNLKAAFSQAKLALSIDPRNPKYRELFLRIDALLNLPTPGTKP
ncbi:MAG: J domain-containing protein [Proteobacteria bacterium]|nr:J domain-containing protein [Pseudomonadota bacterium]